MNDAPDAQLLEQFARNHSEAAFAELVKRHISLVFSVAFRKTGNSQQAQDITQAVFIILARKAGSLGAKTVLPGWLYHTARLTTANAQRAEIRRIRHEQEAFMQSVENESAPDAFWCELSPLLEDAMAGLGTSDRDALVLRYFQNLSLADVGAALGISECVAQRRVSRALEKLRRFFGRRGVISTTAIIAGALSTNSLQAAPPALAQSVTAAALAKGAAASTSTLTLVKGALKIMAWHNIKTAVVTGAALIIATGAGVVVMKVHSRSPQIVPAANDGLPHTTEELNAWYVEPPPGQNAATFELQGINAMQVANPQKRPYLPILGNSQVPSLSTPVPPAMKSALAAFLQNNQDALQLFGQAAQYDQSRYPVDFTKNEGLPYLRGVRNGGQLCEMAAIYDAANNDGQRAADDILAGMGLARSLDAEPIFISQLVRAADVASSVAALEQVLNHTTVPSESLDRLSSAFQSMEAYDTSGEGFTRATVGEAVSELALLKEDHASLLQYYNTDPKMTGYLNGTPDLKGEQDYLETTFEELMSARQKPLPDRLQAVNDVMQNRVAEARSRGLMFTAMNWDSVQHITQPEARCLANLRTAMTAIALEKYRASHGTYPASLADLTPVYLAATPLNPIDGKPFLYQKKGEGYTLQSIAPTFSVIRPPGD